jgi:hypothetical protein
MQLGPATVYASAIRTCAASDGPVQETEMDARWPVAYMVLQPCCFGHGPVPTRSTDGSVSTGPMRRRRCILPLADDISIILPISRWRTAHILPTTASFF